MSKSVARLARALLLACCAASFGSNADALVQGRWWDYVPLKQAVWSYSGGKGPMIVCRAEFNNGEHPGKLWQNRCAIEWGGKDHEMSPYKVLVNDGYAWVNAYDYYGELPDEAVDGGDAGDDARHVRLGVCQAYVATDNTWHPGKYYAGACNIAWGGEHGNAPLWRHVVHPTPSQPGPRYSDDRSAGRVQLLVRCEHGVDVRHHRCNH